MAFDLTKKERLAKATAQKMGGPGYVFTPEEKTFNVYPEGLGGPAYEYWPTETGGKADLRSISIYGGMIDKAQEAMATPSGVNYGSSLWAKQEKEHYWKRKYNDLRQEWSFADDKVEASGLSPDRQRILMAENYAEYQSNVQKIRNEIMDTERKLKQINEAEGSTIDERTASNARIKLLSENMPTIPVERKGTTGTPFSPDALKDTLDFMLGRLDRASSWRPGAYNLTGDEALSIIRKYIPEVGWQFQNTSRKVQIFTTLDRKLREDKEVEWTDSESRKLAEELGLLPKSPLPIEGKNMIRVQSPTGEVFNVSEKEWSKKKEEALNEGWSIL